MRKLFKTTVSVDLIIASESVAEANEVALISAEKEIAQYGKTTTQEVKKHEDLPQDWIAQIPYSKLPNEIESCSDILTKIIASNPPEKKIKEVMQAPISSNRAIENIPTKQQVIDKGLEKIKATTTTTTTKAIIENVSVSKTNLPKTPKLRFNV